jgi:DMSO/TMAO reductase YedYZ heme-binding membrane subunit
MTPAALVVPGLSAYRPGSVAYGVLASELAVLIVVSFSLRRRIGMKNWRRFHWLTYLVFLMGTVHGLTAGTDSSQPWAFALYLGAVGAVTFATAWRVLARPSRPVTARTGGTHVQDRHRPVAL